MIYCTLNNIIAALDMLRDISYALWMSHLQFCHLCNQNSECWFHARITCISLIWLHQNVDKIIFKELQMKLSDRWKPNSRLQFFFSKQMFVLLGCRCNAWDKTAIIWFKQIMYIIKETQLSVKQAIKHPSCIHQLEALLPISALLANQVLD